MPGTARGLDLRCTAGTARLPLPSGPGRAPDRSMFRRPVNVASVEFSADHLPRLPRHLLDSLKLGRLA
jgi:hypothetical protein